MFIIVYYYYYSMFIIGLIHNFTFKSIIRIYNALFSLHFFYKCKTEPVLVSLSYFNLPLSCIESLPTILQPLSCVSGVYLQLYYMVTSLVPVSCKKHSFHSAIWLVLGRACIRRNCTKANIVAQQSSGLPTNVNSSILHSH